VSRSRSRSPIRKVIITNNSNIDIDVLPFYSSGSESPDHSLSRSPKRRNQSKSPEPIRIKRKIMSVSPYNSESDSPPKDNNNYENSICLVELITGITRDQIESLILDSLNGSKSTDISQISINEENHTALVSLSKSELVKSLLELGVIMFFGKAIRIEPGKNWKPTDTGKIYKKKLYFDFSSIDDFINTLSLNRVLLDEISQQVKFSTTNVTLQVHSKTEENLNKAYQSISSILDFH
jgi:hypothetical protein